MMCAMSCVTQITDKTLTIDCHTVTVATVNGMFPGPTVEIDECDTLIVKVTNKQKYPVTMHWCVTLFLDSYPSLCFVRFHLQRHATDSFHDLQNCEIYDVGLIKWLGGYWISRHGIRQFHTNYADGPAYITQCPIQTGDSFTYEFTVNGQRGTFFYHAHINWLRATVHGALIVHPKDELPSSYGEVAQEIPIIIGN